MLFTIVAIDSGLVDGKLNSRCNNHHIDCWCVTSCWCKFCSAVIAEVKLTVTLEGATGRFRETLRWSQSLCTVTHHVRSPSRRILLQAYTRQTASHHRYVVELPRLLCRQTFPIGTAMNIPPTCGANEHIVRCTNLVSLAERAKEMRVIRKQHWANYSANTIVYST